MERVLAKDRAIFFVTKMKQKLEIFIEEEAKGAEKKKFCRPFIIFGILGSLILTWATTGIFNDRMCLIQWIKTHSQ